MYVDLNIPWPTNHLSHLLNQNSSSNNQSKKRSKQQQNQTSTDNKRSASEKHGKLGYDNEDEDDEDKESFVWRGISAEHKKELRDLVECSIRLGYSVIAFNLIIPQSLDPMLLRPYFPFRSVKPPFPDLDPRTASKTNNCSDYYGDKILQLSRLTMVVDENVSSGGKGVFGFLASQSSYLSQYSILSVIPLDGPSFNHSCLSLSNVSPTGIDLITLDLSSSPKLPFHMPLSTVSQAMKNNVHFELNYNSLTSINRNVLFSAFNFPIIKTLAGNINSSSSSSDSGSINNHRKNLLSCVKDLVRVTKLGKNLIVSSCGLSWNELRSGEDLINLLNVLGISKEDCRKCLTVNPKSLVSKSLSTRKTFKGVISNPKIITIEEKNDEIYKEEDYEINNDEKNEEDVEDESIGEVRNKKIKI